MKLERGITILRDVVCIALGMAGISYQQVTGRVQWELLLVYLSLIGVPGMIGLISLRSNAGSVHITGSSQSSVDSSSSSQSSPPSSQAQ